MGLGSRNGAKPPMDEKAGGQQLATSIHRQTQVRCDESLRRDADNSDGIVTRKRGLQLTRAAAQARLVISLSKRHKALLFPSPSKPTTMSNQGPQSRRVTESKSTCQVSFIFLFYCDHAKPNFQNNPLYLRISRPIQITRTRKQAQIAQPRGTSSETAQARHSCSAQASGGLRHA
jgi:hypothetical protein